MYRHKTTLEQWRILQAVVDCGGYAQAASHLNKSQSSLNHAVAKLQTQLGVELLTVVGRKAQLTEAGEVMLRRSRYITQTVEDLEHLASNIQQSWEPEITVAIDLAYPREQLLPALEKFLPDSRGSRLRLLDTVLTGTEDAITQGWADLVIAHSIPKGHLGEPIATVRFVAVCSPSHELASLEQPIDPNALQQQLQIVIKDSALNPREQQGWLKSESRWTVSQFTSAIALLRRGMGFCWLPEHEVSASLADGSLIQLSIAGSTFRQLTSYLVIPSPDNLGPGSQLLATLLLEHRQIPLTDAQ
ncbi:LysR family transcriptional regulator [Alteromonas oceanisediminis]|uniref:LysR family transcriptional regulator n=1 Tax=Alteromonas oceanisediminis TaxID=2836180 RepID=UPI001BD9A5CB|nr:LysR family transcriptional regulator [Alteromonas oceanisediminis]MBT0586493.1 LysR family transcriptional regulator [Alteromonas oceanisediminis]